MSNRTPEEYLKEPYARVLIRDETGQFTAEILEFPGCVTFGNSPDEAFNKLEETAKAWIEVELEQGHGIPPASANYEYSGRIVVRLPKSLHRQAAFHAEREGVSLNHFLVSAIAARVGAEDLFGRIAAKAENPTVIMFAHQTNLPVHVNISSGWQEKHALSAAGGFSVFPSFMQEPEHSLIRSGSLRRLA